MVMARLPVNCPADKATVEDFSKVLDAFLEFLESNETYYRIVYWCDLERDLAVAEDIGAMFNAFVMHMGPLMAKVSGRSSPAEVIFQGYVMASLPQWYIYILIGRSLRDSFPTSSMVCARTCGASSSKRSCRAHLMRVCSFRIQNIQTAFL